jgi:F0F1-type ATP synthase membrane subunit c/vacuolar-type H+-ATPase subunit K
MSRRRQIIELLVVPIALAVLAAGLLIGFANLGGGSQVGTITARSLVDGEMVARVEAPAPYAGLSGSGEVVVVRLILPIEYQAAATVPVRVLSDGSVEIVETRLRMPATGLLIVVGLLGALAGLVIILNLRGFGFVRGTGEQGTMQPSEVDEDRGFYWRS